MQKWQQVTLLILSGLVLFLTLALVVIGILNQKTSQELQAQQLEINRGQLSQQVGTAIVRDMAAASVNNSRIKDLLTKYGFTVTQNPEATGQP
ncbi:MAG: hypothetical protein SH807_10255 [Blastochloris sp.]|nr:hypothetical protein [Blastochloris sp.]